MCFSFSLFGGLSRCFLLILGDVPAADAEVLQNWRVDEDGRVLGLGGGVLEGAGGLVGGRCRGRWERLWAKRAWGGGVSPGGLLEEGRGARGGCGKRRGRRRRLRLWGWRTPLIPVRR